MEIKLGDRVTIPGKSTKGKIAFIGETHFLSGTWFGIILDNPNGKHDGTVDGIRYFKCPKNCGVFIKASCFGKKCVNNSDALNKRSSFIPKRIRFSYDLRDDPKIKTAAKSYASKDIINRRVKLSSQRNNSEILNGDIGTNTNEEHSGSPIMTGCGDSANASDTENAVLIRRYPNYLRASSKLAGSHFRLHKIKDNKRDQEPTVGDHLESNNDTKLISPITDSEDRVDKNGNPLPKRIIYPNYLKTSSKFFRKHLCASRKRDINKAGPEIFDDEIKDTPEDIEQIQNSKGCAESKDTSENVYAVSNQIECPNRQTLFLNFKRKQSCSTRSTEINETISLSKKEGWENPRDNNIQDICDGPTELEALKSENIDLKSKVKNFDASLQEITSKYNKAVEEIKYLKCDNKCLKMQIKFQKSHLKVLKTNQGRISFKKTDSFGILNKKWNQNKTEKLFESSVNEHNNKEADTTDGEFDLKNTKDLVSMHRALELEEEMRRMVQGLIELSEFLNNQCESGTTEMESSAFDSLTRSSKKCPFSGSFRVSTAEKPKIFTTEESAVQLKEYSEMLRQMTRFNELKKEKKGYIKGWEDINSATESSGNTNFTPEHDSGNTNDAAVLSANNFLRDSTFSTNVENLIDISNVTKSSEELQNPPCLKKNGIKSLSETATDQNSQHSVAIATEVNGKVHKQHIGERMSLETTNRTDKLNHPTSAKQQDFNGDSCLTNGSLNERHVSGNDAFETVENLHSKKSEILPYFPIELPFESTRMASKTNGERFMKKSNSKRFERKLPVSTELCQS